MTELRCRRKKEILQEDTEEDGRRDEPEAQRTRRLLSFRSFANLTAVSFNIWSLQFTFPEKLVVTESNGVKTVTMAAVVNL